MTSKEYNLIKEMLKKQAELDKSIMSAYGLNEIDEENLRMAILDEVGELTHELKGDWCWWKKTQAPVDKETPKKPLDVCTPVVKWGLCPVCKGELNKLGSKPNRVFSNQKYCPDCGQALDWSEEENER